MQKLNLLTYADDLFRPMQAKLVEHAQGLQQFDLIYTRNRKDLIETDFYRNNRYIHDKPKGSGYCLFKPYYILETLGRMEENDVLLYMDSADWIENGNTLRDTVLDLMADKDMLLTDGAYKNSDWTRRDTFFYMGCDTPQYHDHIQLEAGIIVVKNTAYTRKIMLEWLHYCKVPEILTEDDNKCGLPDLDGFKEHRYDQSVLTNIKIRHNLYSSGEMRLFIHCNVNMPDCRK